MRVALAIVVLSLAWLWWLAPTNAVKPKVVPPAEAASVAVPQSATDLRSATKIETAPATPAASNLVPGDVGLVAVYPATEQALLRVDGDRLLLRKGDSAPQVGELVRVTASSARQQVDLLRNGQAYSVTKTVSTPQGQSIGLEPLAYESFHSTLDQAILSSRESQAFAPQEQQLLVLSDEFAYAGLYAGDSITAVNAVAIEQMRMIGELGSLLAGGVLRIDVQRNGEIVRVETSEAR